MDERGIGQSVRALRRRSGWRQRDLTRRAGVSTIADVQGLLRPLDAKVRLARGIARDLGWTARGVVACLAAADTTTHRRRIGEHGALFARFAVRGRAAARWLGRPAGAVPGQ